MSQDGRHQCNCHVHESYVIPGQTIEKAKDTGPGRRPGENDNSENGEIKKSADLASVEDTLGGECTKLCM